MQDDTTHRGRESGGIAAGSSGVSDPDAAQEVQLQADISSDGGSTFNGSPIAVTPSLRLPADRWHRLLIGCEFIAATQLLLAFWDTDVSLGLKLVRCGLVVLLAVAGLVATSRLAAAPSRPRFAAAAGPGLLFGTAGMVAGGVIGGGGLAIAGASPAAAFGLLALASGLILTVASFVWLLRSVPRWWRLLGIPVAFVIAQFWLMPVVMAMLGTHAPRPAATAAVPSGAERVAFSAADGTPLAGWYTPSKNGATVIVLAGAGGTKADTAGQAAALTRHGYGVLAYDARGSGESGGHSMLWGWGGESDLSSAVSYLESRSDVDPGRIGVLGESMGGEVAITGAAVDSRLRAAVAEGATGRTCADLTFLANDMEGTIHRADSCLGWALTGLMTDAPQPGPMSESVMALGSRPLLLIAADDAAEHAAMETWQAISPSTVQLWKPAATSHTAGLSTHPAEWEARVIAFLDASL